MKLRCAALALATTLLAPSSSQAEARSCDNGRGGLMTDLGFRQPGRTTVTDPETGKGELRFAAEPRITGVRADGPAAGRLKDGDVIVAVEGYPIATPEGTRLYTEIKPGERMRLTIRRDGRVQDVTITAVAVCVPIPPVPAEPPLAPLPPVPPPPPEAFNPPPPPTDEIMPQGWFGFRLDCNNCGQDEETDVFRFRDPPFIVQVEPGSAAARAGLQAGDRITHVDGVDLTSPAGWPRFFALQPGETARFTYKRGGKTGEATLTAVERP